jgi:nitrous-oxide reductase
VSASGGQQGDLYVYGLPSMKMVAEIPIFTEDQAWAWRTEDTKIRDMMTRPRTGEVVTIGDTHHPAMSRTNGVYDGRWIFVNDKLYGRIARVDLDSFRTGQILWLPNIPGGIHGFGISPNTDLAVANFELERWPTFIDDIKSRGIEADKFEGPLVGGFAGIDIDSAGNMTNAWQVWSPWQHDLMRIGWGDSDGWIINTTYNSERAVETVPMFAREEDYVFFWRRKSIEDAVAARNHIASVESPDVPIVSWQDIEVYSAKVPLNPHGIDVSPTGKYMFVGGKATSLVVVLDFEKVQQAITEKRFMGEEFGVPILDTEFVRAATMDLGLGATHIEFDDKGFAYVGFFVDSDIKKIPLGGPHLEQHGLDPWQAAEVIPYSVGHLLFLAETRPCPSAST